MKNKFDFKQIEIIGAIWGIVVGTLLHFTFEWSGSSKIVALFSSVNESVWEHTKMYFFPILVFLLIEWFWVKDKNKLLFAKMAESVIGILFIIIFFYAYSSVFPENLAIDIASFYLAVGGGKYLSYKICTSDYVPKLPTIFFAASLAIILLTYFAATFEPPKIDLFKEQSSGEYGIPLYDEVIEIKGGQE